MTTSEDTERPDPGPLDQEGETDFALREGADCWISCNGIALHLTAENDGIRVMAYKDKNEMDRHIFGVVVRREYHSQIV